MSINNSGAVLMEPIPQGQRPAPSTGLHIKLPPVHQSQTQSNGAWRGGPMPPPPMCVNAIHASPMPPASNGSSPRMMGRRVSESSGAHMHPPHTLHTLSHPNHSPRQMPQGAPPRSLVGPSPAISASVNSQRMPMLITGVSATTNSGPMTDPRKRMSMPHVAPHPPQQAPQRTPFSRPVARGPQPTSVEPTRARDGRKIKDVQSNQTAGEGKDVQRKPHRFTGPGKRGMVRSHQNDAKSLNNLGSKPIKTTVGNDESWVKGLTFSTWIDSPRGNLNDLESKEGPYKRQAGCANKRRRKLDRKPSSTSSHSGGVLEMLRNLFR
ncbi:hypothetical protein ABL78_5905 [Leptomonas seymouri]|uniref:Uncharacterized protein n=1 Tax=Leptomonas seymouri TaxID=5684 RepID=A0A0N1I456_LEPSE|nr:hypothetical protein ABL78_5905 [Leptomonas seymouri]|eukprot:KPI85043.1 hypothetical protein ABL78_5905 [Leptomonas seymouri]